jgi:SAM-dependent methyltransferase
VARRPGSEVGYQLADSPSTAPLRGPHASLAASPERRYALEMQRSTRPADQLSEHYEIERELADRLRNAPTATKRRALYPVVYRERTERIAGHPLVSRARDAQATAAAAEPHAALLSGLVQPTDTFCEVGAGDGAVASAVASLVGRSIAIDVTDALALPSDSARGYEFRTFDGFDLGLHDEVDVAYSNDVAEHLHSDDFGDHARAILDALVPGGIYLCVTPNRLSGPHDVSRDFTPTPTGFHLREYTCAELARALRDAGFRRTQVIVSVGGRRIGPALPVELVAIVEAVIARLPRRLRVRVAHGLAAFKILATK